MSFNRQVLKIIDSHPTSDGDGVRIQRVTGFRDPRFSPFLMLDELKSDRSQDYIGGFPPHPHRGIETLTYMLCGHFQHRDQMGNISELKTGGAQWMATGRGVIHSEMPIMQDGRLHGFQIWINQPAKNKMQPAQYRDFQSDSITLWRQDRAGILRLIAGDLTANTQALQGPLQTTGVPLSVADWQAQQNDQISLGTLEHHNAFIYTYKGTISIDDKKITQGQLALLSHEKQLSVSANEESGALIFIGEPISEPIVHYGPFVMNSEQEIEQTILDYQSGLFDSY